MRRRRLVASLAVVSVGVACGLPVRDLSQAATGASQLAAGHQRERRGGQELVHYRWIDSNAGKVIGRQGDTLVLDLQARPHVLSYTAEIDLQRLREVVEGFGIPEAWLGFSYRSEAERRAKERDRARRLRSRGFNITNNVASVDPDWVVRTSRDDMHPVAGGLVKVAQGRGHREVRGFYGVVASFVQALEYRLPPTRRRARDGSTIFTGGVTLPLETLHVAAGDCDTKSLLLASILANVRGAGIVFLEGNDHMFAGIRGAPRKYDRYVRVQGVTYVLVELTSPWPLGLVPQEHWTGVRANRFRVIPVLPLS